MDNLETKLTRQLEEIWGEVGEVQNEIEGMKEPKFKESQKFPQGPKKLKLGSIS